MTHENSKPEANLDKAISALRSDEPDAKAVEAARERIWAEIHADMPADSMEQIRGCADVQSLLPAYRAGTLSQARVMLVNDHLHECVACRTLAQSGAELTTTWTPVAVPGFRWRAWATAAAVLVIVGVSALLVDKWFFASPPGMRAKVQSVNGTAYLVSNAGERALAAGNELAEGDIVRTAGGSHAFLQLRDGSVVEMNERAEFSVSARRKDTTVHLDQGSIIVQAAKRQTGHLYVLTPDCRVAVTGTVFSVNSGMKGSRVSVIEGEVHVAHAGAETILHAGDQTSTSASMADVPVQAEIAWSSNLDKHLALLAQFAILQKKFEQIPMPGLRFSSDILGRLPSNTVVYAAVPNLGDALSEANRMFQEQLQQSAVLREWWYGRHTSKQADLDQLIEKIHALSQYLGDEVVLAALSGPAGGEERAVILAEVRRQGLAEFLRSDFATLDATNTGKQHSGVRVVDQAQLASMGPASTTHELLALVRPDFVLFSPSVASLQLVNAQLNSGSGAFAGTDFGQQIQATYQRGTGFLLAVNLQQIIASSTQAQVRNVKRGEQSQLAFQRTGFKDAKYLFVSHRDLSGTPDNRAVIDFAGARHGIASWLAAPSPMGSLEFVSANAGLAVSWIAKDPALMLDDVLQIAGENSQAEFAKADSELGVSLRNDLAAAFGGEATLALDGPILPKPSWKLIAEVNDPQRLQNTIEQVVAMVNRHAAAQRQPGAQLQQQDVRGQRFYVLTSLDPKKLNTELHYTFSGGYLVVAPSRALVIGALQTKASPENSLARSSEFRSLLPKDNYADFSAVMYQNLAPMLQPIFSQLTAEQQQSVRQLMADAKPAVICAYGGESQIEIASASKIFPFNPNLVGLSALLGKRMGTSRSPHP